MWQESSDNKPRLTANMLDLVFRIDCPQLPVDHAALLSSAVCEHIPTLAESPRAGIHPIHVAGSQNGWERPEDADDLLLLSKRTRFRVRIESDKAQSLLEQLCGVTLDVGGYPLRILSGQARAFEPAPTLFSRFTYFENDEANTDEQLFIDRVIEQCRSNNFVPTKILCGREHIITIANAQQITRSVLLADVPAVSSMILQESGLGDHRVMGCGLLIPHKDTGEVV